MHFVRSPLRKLSACNFVTKGKQKCVQDERGSQIVGFALVAPLIIYVAIAAMQLTAIAVDKVTVATAAHTAARTYGTRGGSEHLARVSADRYLKTNGLTSCGNAFAFKRSKVSGTHLVEVRVTQCLRLSAFNRTVQLVSIARSIDESRL